MGGCAPRRPGMRGVSRLVGGRSRGGSRLGGGRPRGAPARAWRGLRRLVTVGRRLLPASRRCHTAPARNAALCPTLLPQRAARSLLPEPKKAVFFSDFAGSGVDTQWAVQFRAVPDPAGFCLIVCLARALSAAHAGNDLEKPQIGIRPRHGPSGGGQNPGVG